MDEIESGTVDLVVSSPPYDVEKEYEKGVTLHEWDEMMLAVMKECDRVMKQNARACINIVGIFRKPYIPLYNHVINFSEQIGWKMRGIALWMKTVAKQSTGWGSFGSPSDPVLRDNHEFILIFQKGDFTEDKNNSGITSEEFVEFTNGEWYFSPAKASEIGHPAPFPDELPRRCILLYTGIGDTVLDPFGGSATTLKVARALNRKGIIYERNDGYLPVIERRLKEPLVIQSKGYELHLALEAKLPEVVDMSTQGLREDCKKLGSKKSTSMNRIQLVEEYIKLKSRPSLLSYTSTQPLIKPAGKGDVNIDPRDVDDMDP